MGSALTEDTIAEGAFRLYWRFIREPDEARARQRFAKLKPQRRTEWEEDAKAVLRVADIHMS